MELLLRYNDVIKLLIDNGVLNGTEPIMVVKPTHGTCCTCQICGFNYDDCVCDHNRILHELKRFRFSMVKSVPPKLLSEDIVSVQPMTTKEL